MNGHSSLKLFFLHCEKVLRPKSDERSSYLVVSLVQNTDDPSCVEGRQAGAVFTQSVQSCSLVGLCHDLAVPVRLCAGC